MNKEELIYLLAEAMCESRHDKTKRKPKVWKNMIEGHVHDAKIALEKLEECSIITL